MGNAQSDESGNETTSSTISRLRSMTHDVHAFRSQRFNLRSLPQQDSRFELEVDPVYFGIPVTVRVKIRGNQISRSFERSWYVERIIMHNGMKLGHSWVNMDAMPSPEAIFTEGLSPKSFFDLQENMTSFTTPPPNSEESKMIFCLYTNGGYISKGVFRCYKVVSVINPLREMKAEKRGAQLMCTLSVVHRTLRSAVVTVKYDGFRVHSAKLDIPTDGLHDQSFCLLRPRINGTYQISFLYGATEGCALGKKVVLITDADKCKIVMHDKAPGMITKALSVSPGDSITLRYGPVQHLNRSLRLSASLKGDAVAFLPTESNGTISLSALQTANKAIIAVTSRENDEDGVLVVQAPTSIGLFAVVLCLQHENGVYLPGDQCLLFVTPLAQSSVLAINPWSVPLDDVLPPLNNDSAGPSSEAFQHFEEPVLTSIAGAVCCVCQDREVNIKLDPCKHVVLCEKCATELQNLPQTFCCPICRKAVQSQEKVFLS